MVHLAENLYIDFDSRNYILCEKMVVKDEKSKNFGEEYFVNILFGSQFKYFIKSVAEYMTRKKGMAREIKNMHGIAEEFENALKTIDDSRFSMLDELRDKLRGVEGCE